MNMAEYLVEKSMGSTEYCCALDLIGDEYVSSGTVKLGNVLFDVFELSDRSVLMHARKHLNLEAVLGVGSIRPFEWALSEPEFDALYDTFRTKFNTKFNFEVNPRFTSNVNASWKVLKDRCSNINAWLEHLDKLIDSSKYKLRNITR